MVHPIAYSYVITSCLVLLKVETKSQTEAIKVAESAPICFALNVFLIFRRLHLLKIAQIGSAKAFDIIDISIILVSPKMKNMFSEKLHKAGYMNCLNRTSDQEVIYCIMMAR